MGALLPQYCVMQALDQGRDLSLAVEDIANPTFTALDLLSMELASVKLVALQNGAVLHYPLGVLEALAL